MGRGARIAISGVVGAGIGGVLSAAVYLLMTALDGSATAEAMAFSVFFGIGGAVAGLVLGIVVGAGNLGLVGGAIAGLLATAAGIAAYIFAYGGPDRYGYFLSESSILLLVCTVPLIVTGLGVAALNRRLRRRAATPPAGN